MAARRAEELGPARGWLRSSRSGTVLAVYAAALLMGAMALPWWHMENRAPQYGKRVLVIDVSPAGVRGDVKELDTLGHYVGIRSIDTFAPIERAAAPYAVGLTALCALALPFLRPGKVRLALAILVACVPIGFIVDLWAWQQYAVTHLDPHAALNMIADRVQARLIGNYSVAQFHVDARFDQGFWLAVVAAANAIGFVIAERRRTPCGPELERAAAAPLRPGLAGAAAALLAMFGGAALARGATLEVGDGAPYRTIGAAIAAAGAGDEVLVRPGVHAEHVVVDRPLTLAGAPGAVIDGGGEGTVVLVSRGPSVVRGLTVRGSGDSLLGEDAGVKVKEAAGCAVEACRIEDALFGILLRSAPEGRVIGNTVIGKALPVPRRGDGIRLQDAAGSLVERNTVEGTRDLAIWQSDRCETRGNVVRDGRYGLHYMYCDDNVFEDNVFENNHTGGAIMYSRRVTLRRNRFSGSRGPSAHGLLLKTADDVLAERNFFLDNSRGIFVDGSPSSRYARCTIRGNVIAGNDAGVSLEPSVAGAVFAENVFVANRVQVEALGRMRADQNRWSEAGRGNYWSDYVGFDADGDGVGDTPYRLEQFFENLADRWPAVGLLRAGPAAQALEVAARAFPIVKPEPTLVDERPLVEPPSGVASPVAPEPRPKLAAVGALLAALAVATVARARRANAAREEDEA